MGFATLGKLAHELENVLNLMRNGQLVADSPAIDTMLKAADKLRWMIEHIDRSNEVDISEHLSALEQVIQGLIESESPAPWRPRGPRQSPRRTRRSPSSRNPWRQPQGLQQLSNPPRSWKAQRRNLSRSRRRRPSRSRHSRSLLPRRTCMP